MENFEFRFNFHWSVFLGSNWQYESTGSGNGLAKNWRQTITWTNVDTIHQRIYAAPGGDELISGQGATCNTFW